MAKPLKLPLVRNKTDVERREQQANHFIRIILVHNKTSHLETVSVEVADEIAKELGCSQRTVWRDVKVLRGAYEKLGGRKLEG